MHACQNLYEAGFITYMRTDSKKYSDGFLSEVRKYLLDRFNDENIYLLRFRPCHVAVQILQPPGAHESIRPTKVKQTTVSAQGKSITSRECKVYKLIWETSVQSCMASAEYRAFTSYLTCPESQFVSSFEKNVQYQHVSQDVVFLGWEAINPCVEDNGTFSYLKTITEGAILECDTLKGEGHIVSSGSHYSEARLVQLLEEKGIGRPSTFSSLVEKVKERGYVERTNIEGKKVNCVVLDAFVGSGHKEKTIKRTTKQVNVGGEKNKLVLQQTGHVVIEYLMEHFSELFNYGYTSEMEEQLEKVSLGEECWTTPCSNVKSTLERIMRDIPMDEKKKFEVELDDQHVYIISSNGPVVKYTNPDTKKVTFKPVRDGLDTDKLVNGEYVFADVLLHEKTDEERNEWMYDGCEVVVKKGKYGLYMTWNGSNVSLKGFGNRPPENIRMDEVLSTLEAHKNGSSLSILRQVTDDVSIRVGKRNSIYVFYKTPKMKKTNVSQYSQRSYARTWILSAIAISWRNFICRK